jgi:tetratricopeptide (TPR) repeat protein
LEADVLSRHSHCLANSGRGEEGRDEGVEAVALAREIGEPVLLGKVLYRRASVAEEVGEEIAESLYLEALELVDQSGDEHTASSVHNNYACLLIDLGKPEEARRHLMSAFDPGGSVLTGQSTSAYSNLGWMHLKEDDPHAAAPYFTGALRANRLNGMFLGMAYSVMGLAGCATLRGAWAQAATLYGGADALLAARSAHWETLEASIRADHLAILRDRLAGDFEGHYQQGLSLPYNEIIQLALRES